MTIRAILKLSAIALAASLAACSSDDPIGAAPKTSSLFVVRVSGGGTVASAPAGISCREDGGDCNESFPVGQFVTLTPTPDPGWQFREWARDVCPDPVAETGACTIEVTTADIEEVAIFDQIHVDGNGLGDSFGLVDNPTPAADQLISFHSADPATLISTFDLSGIDGELVGIDFRPSNGALYGVAKNTAGGGDLYVINQANGRATRVASVAVALSGPEFGVDFDPTKDRLVVSDGAALLTINPDSGAVEATTTASSGLSAVAYTNPFHGAARTKAYGISAGKLGRIGEDGIFTAVGDLAVGSVNGFDIDAVSGEALVAADGVLHNVSLVDGASLDPQALPVTGLRGLALRTPGTPEVFAICEKNTVSDPSDPRAPKVQCSANRTIIKFSVTNPAGYSVVGTADKALATLSFSESGQLWALGGVDATSTAFTHLHRLDPVTGAVLSSVSLSTAEGHGLVSANRHGMDFHPNLSQIRILARNEAYNRNLAMTVPAGTTVSQGTLQLTPFEVTDIAYASNYSGATTTTLYGLDDRGHRLYEIDSTLSEGELTPVGATGLTAGKVVSFEIVSSFTAPDTVNDAGYAVVNTTATEGTTTTITSRLYSINVKSGQATPVGAQPIAAAVGAATMVGFEMYATTIGVNPKLVSFNPSSPHLLTSQRSIQKTGGLPLNADEEVIGLDHSVANGRVYMLTKDGTTGRLYTLNVSDGTATPVGTDGILRTGPTAAYELAGSGFGMEVSPVLTATSSGPVLTIKVVNDQGKNLSINAATALVVELDDLARDDEPVVVAAAYKANGDLIALDADDDQIISVAFDGSLEPLSSSTVSNSANTTASGLDIIGAHDGLALLAIQKVVNRQTEGFTTVFSVNPETGAVLAGAYEGGRTVGRAPDVSSTKDTRLVIRGMALRFPPQ